MPVSMAVVSAEAPPVPVAVIPTLEPGLQEPPAPVATILPFPTPVKEDADWTPESWTAWVQRSELSGMALSVARHALLTGTKQEARLELSPQHDLMAARALEPLLARLAQDYPDMAVRRESCEPSGMTPLEIEQERQRVARADATQAFLADNAVQALMQAFDARLLEETLMIAGEKR